MHSRISSVLPLLLASSVILMSQMSGQAITATPVRLTVAAGVPLRVSLTRRALIRAGEPVRANVLEPVFAFDRVVIPNGATILGNVIGTVPVPAKVRAKALLAGDFTPLHRGRMEFTSVLLPDGRQIPIQTVVFPGSSTLVTKGPSKSGQGVRGVLDAQTKRIADAWRCPHKAERLVDALVLKLPYHPQWYSRGTRLDAVLQAPLQFGIVDIPTGSLRAIGLPPPVDSAVPIRLIRVLSSATAKRGDEIEAVTSQPLFSGKALILPTGTHVTGAVQQVRAARSFHRNGSLRFQFNHVGVSAYAPQEEDTVLRADARPMPFQVDPQSKVLVDEEGGVKATESKAHLFAPILAGIMAGNSLDDDGGRGAVGGTASVNPSVSGVAGFSGFGLVGTIAGLNSQVASAALGYYGLAWSLYSHIVSRGRDVEFGKNTTFELRFGPRR